MSQDPYVYAGTITLKNRLSIRDVDRLAYHEREFVVQRIAEGVPAGGFDLTHLRDIHRYLHRPERSSATSTMCTRSVRETGGRSFNI